MVINYMFLNFICDQARRLKAAALGGGTALKGAVSAREVFEFTSRLPCGYVHKHSAPTRLYLRAALGGSQQNRLNIQYVPLLD